MKAEAKPGMLSLITYDGAERDMIEIPAAPGDGWSIAIDLNWVLQKAYDYGRQDQQGIIENNLQNALRDAKKGMKRIRLKK